MRFGTVPNTGSNARDYCMLERNLLSHLRLALLLSVLSSSLLLRARLVPPTTPNSTNLPESSRIPLSAVEFGAAIASIIAGIWEYHTSCKDLRDMRAFLSATKSVSIRASFCFAI